MNQFAAIAGNTYLQAVRQPIYGIIVLVALGGLAISPFFTGFTLDDDNKMLRDIGLSTLLIQALFLACFVASSVVDSEIEDKTALTVAAKPIHRSLFILGKYAGVLGAILTAHYLAGLVFFMALRHGVLQSAAETSDVTVLILGPGVMLLVVGMAALLNYAYDRRFLPSVIGLSVPCLTVSTLILLLINRDFELQRYETRQPISYLWPEVAEPAIFQGIVRFQPDDGEAHLPGHAGHLVRSNWKGPISDEDRRFLLGLSDRVEWKRTVNYLVKLTRSFQGLEILKAGILIIGAIALLAGIAVAVSTRLGVLATFLVTILLMSAGLASDQVIKPLAESGRAWALVAYRFIPNFQCFWMVDALNEDRIIPLVYIASAGAYAMIYSAAMLLLAMALFETREVG